jgi:cbb3-type cytochrome oxidase maturation protein
MPQIIITFPRQYTRFIHDFIFIPGIPEARPMSALSMTILLGILVMLVLVIALVITVKSGQYDDLDGPAYRILMDDDDPRIPGNQPRANIEESEGKTDQS